MLKDTIRQALKLYGRTYLAAIMGGFIYLSVSVIMSMTVNEGETISDGATLAMNLIALVLQVTLFYIIVYTKLWELGDKNANAANFGHIVGDPLRGLKIGLLAAIPSVISFLALVADKLFGLWTGMATLYRICHLGLYPIVALSMGSVVTVTTADVSWGGIWCAGLPVLLVPVVATLGYFLGYRHVLLWEKIVFASKKK
ncbi:MAG: hypothetical protein IKU56_03855 [Clostridia bacterium]|nr:hypothetical protein [Clostridia bacterium]